MGIQRHGGLRPRCATRPVGDRVDGRRSPVQSQDAQVNPCLIAHTGHRHGQAQPPADWINHFQSAR